MKYFLSIFFLCAAIAVADEAADIVKCTQPDGTVVYTNKGCDSGKAEVVVSKPITIVEHVDTRSSLEKTLPVISLPLVFAIYLFMSGLCFLVYWIDKRQANNEGWRIPELYLHWLEFLGGWPGALVAQLLFRHKLRKAGYQMIFWSIVVFHEVVWADCFLLNHVLLNFVLLLATQVAQLINQLVRFW